MYAKLNPFPQPEPELRSKPKALKQQTTEKVSELVKRSCLAAHSYIQSFCIYKRNGDGNSTFSIRANKTE